MASLAWHERESLVMEGGTTFYFVTAESTKRWHAQRSRGQQRRQDWRQSPNGAAVSAAPIAFPLLLVGRDAIETCHASDDEYREVGLCKSIEETPGSRANVDNAAPAAGINSNAVDMAQWIRLQLGEGVYQGKRVLSAQRVREMQTANIVLDIPKGGLDKFHVPADHFLTCGLGWFVMDYRGRKIVLHPGAIQGFKSEVLLVPEEKLGIAILSNLYDRPLPWVLGYRVIDAYLNVPPRDWAGEYLKALKGFEEDERAKDAKAEAERNRETKPSLPIERYAGTYKNEMFGDAIVSVDDGHLICTLSA